MPLYADKTCKPYTAHDAAELLGAQVESPVRWTELIRTMNSVFRREAPARLCIETEHPAEAAKKQPKHRQWRRRC